MEHVFPTRPHLVLRRNHPAFALLGLCLSLACDSSGSSGATGGQGTGEATSTTGTGGTSATPSSSSEGPDTDGPATSSSVGTDSGPGTGGTGVGEGSSGSVETTSGAPTGTTGTTGTAGTEETSSTTSASGLPGFGEFGGPCNENADCAFENGACHLDAWGTPMGMCTVFCSEPVTDPICPGDSICGCAAGDVNCACFMACQEDTDCRQDDGYTCHCPDQGCMPSNWSC